MNAYGPRDKWWDPDKEALWQQRSAEQIRLVRQALRDGAPVGLHPWVDDDRLDDVQYMYRADTVLTSDADAPRVRRLLGMPEMDDKRQEGLPDPINGLTVLKVDDARTVVDQVDRAMGKGVVRYDTVVHVSPVTYCPATEPEPTKKGPDPAINRKADAGKDVRVAVVVRAASQRSSSSTPGSTASRATRRPPPRSGTTAATARSQPASSARWRQGPRRHLGLFPHGGAALESEARPRLVDVFLSNVDIISMSMGLSGGNSLLSLQAVYDNYLKGSKTLLVCAAGSLMRPPVPLSQRARVGRLLSARSTRTAGRLGIATTTALGGRVGSRIRRRQCLPEGAYKYMEPRWQGSRTPASSTAWRAGAARFATPLVAGLVAARMSTYGENAHQAWAASPPSLPVGRQTTAGVGCFSPATATDERQVRGGRRRLSVGFHLDPRGLSFEAGSDASAGGGRVAAVCRLRRPARAAWGRLRQPRPRLAGRSDGSGGVRPT